MDISNMYNDPILSKRRKGTHDDPFFNIQETLQVNKGKVILTEIPNRFNKVKVVDAQNKTFFEVEDGELKDNLFKVDYTQGVVFFSPSKNEAYLTLTYLGEGVHYFPDDRVYHETGDDEIVTVRDKFADVDREILEQKNRVDEQIRSVPQPSEVVDMRVDNNGKVFAVAKDRIDSEQEKIEAAYKDRNEKVFTSLRGRINAEQIKIEDAYRDMNGTVHPSLYARINSEQAKIEGAYIGSDGRSYTSLKQRYDTIDTTVASVKRRVANTVADMKNGSFVSGEFVETLGYYTVNDGGHGKYYVDNTADTYGVTLNNGLVAHLIIESVINPLQFGARGNGSTDASPAIQKALSKAKDIGGATVVIPYGKYLLSSTLVIYKNTSLITDQGTQLIRNHTGYMLVNGETTSQFTGYNGNGNIIVQGGIWDGKGATYSTAATLLSFGHSENVTVRDAIIKDVVNNHGMEINSSKNFLVENCKFMGFRNTSDRDYAEAINIDKATLNGFPAFGAYDTTACKNVTIQNCYFGKSETSGMTSWGRGIGTHGADQAAGSKHSKININNNLFEGMLQWAIYVTHWDDSSVNVNKIIDSGGGIRVAVSNQDMYRINVSENVILNSGNYGLANISFTGTKDYELRSVDCSNNIIYSVSAKSVSGIYAAYCNGCKIDGNTIRNTDTDAITVRFGRYYSIVNNSIVSCAGSGIYFWTDVAYSNIVNNQLGYVGLNGIHITDNIDTIIVASNTISGVNGKKTNDCNHIRVTDLVDRLSLSNNVCRDIAPDYKATKALYITYTCTNISRTGNIFKGVNGTVEDNSKSLVTGDLV
jgi:hypothetical protein